jgi:hypothetical protein
MIFAETAAAGYGGIALAVSGLYLNLRKHSPLWFAKSCWFVRRLGWPAPVNGILPIALVERDGRVKLGGAFPADVRIALADLRQGSFNPVPPDAAHMHTSAPWTSALGKQWGRSQCARRRNRLLI